jgi:predicted NAD/FAD-binding protein
MRVAVIGAGVAGLTTAWLLQDAHEVTLIEKEERLGGHAHTVAVPYDGTTIPVESGFEFFVQEGLSRLQPIVARARHPAAQQQLAARQGRSNLWFAGVHTHDIDSHESAVQSAISVARRLAPAAKNLAALAR